MLDRLRYYGRYATGFAASRIPGPLIYGVAPTDRCNLACRECHVSNSGRPDMSWERLIATLTDARRRGFRELYFTGGEPMLWSDGERTLDHAVDAARELGYFHVHVYTNGTLGLLSNADLMWVSMDGLPETYALRRGDHFAHVEAAVRDTHRPPVALIYTVDRFTESGIEEFLAWVRDSRLPVTGVMFYFHTPYYGRDELFLDAGERAVVIDRLIACARAREPMLNSIAGLRALKSGRWPRRLPCAAVADIDGESVCCRASDAVCAECGYSACAEIWESMRLRPSAMLAMGRYL